MASDGEHVEGSMHYVARALFIFLSSLELMVGVTGNWLLLVVLVRRRSLRVRSFHNLFIANLAMADLLALAYWLPYFVVDLVMEHRLVLDKDHCAANGFVIITSRVVSILSLMGISLNRYLHVCYHHLYSRVFTLPRTIVCCLALWILGLALALPPLLGVGSYDYNNNTHTCSFDRGPSNVYLATVVSVLCVLPMCCVGYWNFAIFRHWKSVRLSLTNRYPAGTGQERERRRGIETEQSDQNDGSPTEVCENRKRGRKRARIVELNQSDSESSVPALEEEQQDGSPELGAQAAARIRTVEDQAQSSRRLTFRQNLAPRQEASPAQSAATPVGSPRPARLQRGRRVRAQTTPLEQLTRRRQKERAREEAFIRSLCVVFILILISIFPFGVITTVSSALPGSIPTEVAVLSVLLYYFNCSVNWIVYGVMNRSFRRGYVMHVKRVLGTCCRCPCDRVFGEKLNISTDSIDNEFERSAHSTEHASQV